MLKCFLRAEVDSFALTYYFKVYPYYKLGRLNGDRKRNQRIIETVHSKNLDQSGGNINRMTYSDLDVNDDSHMVKAQKIVSSGILEN